MLFDFKIFSFSNIFMEYFIFSSKKKKKAQKVKIQVKTLKSQWMKL